MDRFRRNIDRILLSGGTPADKERWTEYYHVYQCAINATKDAYMPNAQRKKEYLRIYEDVARQNEILVSYLAKRQNATATSTLLNATDNRTLHKGRHCPQCHEPVAGITPCGAWLAIGRQRKRRR